MKPAILKRLLKSPEGRYCRRSWALLDIREAGEAHLGHIPTATALPRRILEYRIRSIVPDFATRIVVYDAGRLKDGRPDRRASLAARTLAGFGYTDIEILQGGFSVWQASQGAIATGANVPSKLFGEKVLEADQVPAITARELSELLANQANIAIRDVRTVEEFVHHHLPGAVSTPGFDLATSLGRLSTDHDLVVINCAGRTRSIIATATARHLGIENVRALENGTMGWRLAGEKTLAGATDLPSEVASADQNDLMMLEKARALAQSIGLGMIEPDQLAPLLDDPARRPVIVDLRPLSQFSDGHLPQAVALPGGQAIQRTDEFLTTPGRPVVLCDAGELRAHLAGYWLKRMGFESVSVLAGGFERWRQAGHPVATGRHERPFIPNEARLMQAVPLIDPTEVADTVDADYDDQPPAILDLRTSRDYRSGHATGSIWAPRGWLEDAVSDYPASKTLIVVGQNDAQALLAACQLIDEGYRKVAIMKGGLEGWRKAGLAVETGLPANAERYLPDLVEAPYTRDLATMKAYLDWEVALHAAGPAPR
jgi:rhodanese-related sulfurtransferase